MNFLSFFCIAMWYLCIIFPLFQYGSDEFAHDSPRYTSPTAASTYYLADGTPGAVGDWPSSYGTSYQPYDTYGLISETEGQGLPPMSSFRTNGGTPVTTATGPNNATFGPANHTDGVTKALGAVRD